MKKINKNETENWTVCFQDNGEEIAACYKHYGKNSYGWRSSKKIILFKNPKDEVKIDRSCLIKPTKEEIENFKKEKKIYLQEWNKVNKINKKIAEEFCKLLNKINFDPIEYKLGDK